MTNGRAQLIEQWKQEEATPFAGWDFAHLAGRMIEDEPHWSFHDMAAELGREASAVLDIGTGGGERLAALRSSLPERVVAMEGYAPNAPVARKRLRPLAVETILALDGSGEPLPFAGGAFDLVLNRHSAFNATDVRRVLKPGGTFFTQQVDGRWAEELVRQMGAERRLPDWRLESARAQIESGGLTINRAEEWHGSLTFTDVAAVVYYLNAIPWTVPGFSLATHVEPLLALQDRLDSGGSLTFGIGLFLVQASRS